MPTEAVDMGWLSNRFWQLDGVTQDLPTFDAYILETFGRIRTAMNAENGGNNWNVGFFPRWEGLTDRYGYGFKIERLSGGSPTGQEWWFMFAGPHLSFADTYAELAEIFGSETDVNNYFTFSTASATFEGGFALHYHRGGGSTTYDLGTLTADFQDPASVGGQNPHANPTAFMPAFGVNPYSKGAASGNLSEPTEYRWVWLYNHEVPFCGLYMSEGQTPWVDRALLAGDLIVPRVASDTFIESTIGSDFQDGDAWEYDSLQVEILGFNGVQENVSADTHNIYNWLNQPRSDGTWDLDPIKIYNNNTDKGYIRDDVIGIQGVSTAGQLYQLFNSDTGLALKLHDRIVYPWTNNAPIPFAGYPINPQSVIRS